MLNVFLNKSQKFLKRMFLSLLFFFVVCLLIDFNIVKQKVVLDNQIDFSYIRSKVNILFGKYLFQKEKYVSSEKIISKKIEPYYEGYKLTVDNNYVIKSIMGGVVTFIGEKDYYGKTVIINCDDGTNIWYGNLENINVNLYDYIDKSTILGSTKNTYFFLVFEKNQEYLNYEEYL